MVGRNIAIYSSLFTHSSPLFTRLPLSYISDSYKQIGLTLLGMFHLAPQEFERLAYANLGTQIAYQHRKSFVQNLETSEQMSHSPVSLSSGTRKQLFSIDSNHLP